MYLCKMKRTLVFFLLFIFILQSTKSLWIITSFHVNRDYIAKNLCINRFDKIPTCKGQCFLNNELSKEQKDSKKNQTTIEKESLYTSPKFSFFETKKFLVLTSKRKLNFYKEIKNNPTVITFENPPELV